jgi:predicted nucleic acid-binding protein
VLIVDTNVLVYAADRDSPFHDACRAWLEQQRGRADACATWAILYEFLRVASDATPMECVGSVGCGQKPGIFPGTTMNALKQEVPD